MFMLLKTNIKPLKILTSYVLKEDIDIKIAIIDTKTIIGIYLCDGFIPSKYSLL